ncbi:MAG: hypothetical protein HFH82_14515 [Lachnospiraceae bacterium]|jgi:hypothetical protein|nr:hypothetical protein [Lachnospiraceae bacterium]
MRKRISSVPVLLLLVCMLSAQAVQATGQRVVGGRPSLHFRGTTAVCSVICRGDSEKDTVEATLTLYQGSTYIDSWSESGSGLVVVSGEHKAQSGKTYRLEMAYSINGVERPVVSVTNTCP